MATVRATVRVRSPLAVSEGRVFEKRTPAGSSVSLMGGFIVSSRVGAIALHNQADSTLYLDRSSTSWEFVRDMPSIRSNYAGGYWNGKFYMYGGNTSDGVATNTFYEFDPATNEVTTLPVSGITARAYCYGHCENGIFYVFGGFPTDMWDTANYFNELWAYNISTQTWSQKASPSSRISNRLVGGYGNLYVCYAMTPSLTSPSYDFEYGVWRYSIEGNSWTRLWGMDYESEFGYYYFDGFCFHSGIVWYQNEHKIFNIFPDNGTWTNRGDNDDVDRNCKLVAYGKYIIFSQGFKYDAQNEEGVVIKTGYINTETGITGSFLIYGSAPAPYYGFELFIDNDILYLIGGTPYQGVYSNRIYRLFLKEFL